MAKEFGIEWSRNGMSRVMGGDSLAAVAPLLADWPEIVVVYDRNVAWVAEEVMNLLSGLARNNAADARVLAFPIDTSEGVKTMEGAMALARQMLEADVSREALLLAVGGGVTTDLTGFVASMYKRGVRYANLPTTLLAQVDAAIGGKTGVNLDGFKNELGAFHMPAFTFLCPEPLRTLPQREFRCGVAEMLKTFLIADADAYRRAIDLLSVTNMLDLVSGPGKIGPSSTKTPQTVSGTPNIGASSTKMAEMVLRAAEIKAAIVQEDPYDRGNRQKLNLGHTFAHALEAVQAIRADATPLKHGEAVAVGMVLAAQLAEILGIAQIGLAEQLNADFKAVGLPTDTPVAPGDLLDAMRKDKKAAGSAVRFVLPVKPGEVCIRELPLEDISAAF